MSRLPNGTHPRSRPFLWLAFVCSSFTPAAPSHIHYSPPTPPFLPTSPPACTPYYFHSLTVLPLPHPFFHPSRKENPSFFIFSPSPLSLLFGEYPFSSQPSPFPFLVIVVLVAKNSSSSLHPFWGCGRNFWVVYTSPAAANRPRLKALCRENHKLILPLFGKNRLLF